MMSEREFPNSYFCSDVVLAYAKKRKEKKIEHCGEHIGLLFYNRQTIGQINI